MWNSIFTLILIICFIITIKVLSFKGRKKKIIDNRTPNGPKGWFLIGHLPLLIFSGPEKIIEKTLKLYRIYEKYNLIQGWVLHRLYIVLTRPEDIEFFLTNPKHVKKAQEYKVLQQSVMGQGIFSIDDIVKWKNNRKMVSKGFNFSILKSFIPIFYEEANVLVEILLTKSKVNSNGCDISDPVSMATMEMIGKTALGVTFNAQKNSGNRFVENLQTAMHTWGYRVMHPWYLSEIIFSLSSLKKKHDRSQQIINEFTDEIIMNKFNELNQNVIDEKIVHTDVDNFDRKTKTVIEILLESPHGILTHEQIRDELITIMIGGQETTATTNACTIFMLAHHQEVQCKVFDEMESIFSFGDYNRQPTYDDLQQMEYLERVIKETLRHFPPLPVIGRQLEEDTQIGEYRCPAGSTIVVCPLFLQSSPLYYANPEKFDPDNFLPDACRSRHPYTSIPFGAGLRNCIGIKYAMIQMKTVISTVVRKTKLSPADKCPTPADLKVMFLTTLKLVDGCHVKIEPRF